jgi:hypothetical protein
MLRACSNCSASVSLGKYGFTPTSAQGVIRVDATNEFITAASAMLQKRTSIRLSLAPSCPIGTASAFSRIKSLAPKLLQEFLCVTLAPETINVKPLTVVIEGLAS